jgi:hypothetical protein
MARTKLPLLARELDVDVDSSTWPKGGAPPKAFKPSVGPEQVDMKAALLMLGTLTMPSLLSPASPARFWAWLRYTIAISSDADLKITSDFADLDPHQKGILSDDLGVAVSTQWLYQRLGGVKDIVDGRRFMLQFSHLMRRKKIAKAKVGPGKAPDFVVQDLQGLWHVLECKGTQSGRGWRNQFLKRALQQKGVIRLKGSVRGERLAAGLSISNERERTRSQLRVIDPTDSPDAHIELGEDQRSEIESAAHRIAVARALGVVGLNEAAMAIWLPDEVHDADEFLLDGEITRLRQSRATRQESAGRQSRDSTLERFQRHSQRFEGRSTEVDLPQIGIESNIRHISVRIGVNEDLIRQVQGASDVANIAEQTESYAAGARVSLESGEDRAVLRYGDLLYAEMKLTEA